MFPHCTECYYVGEVTPDTNLECHDCGDILRPTDDLKGCEHKWCEEVDEHDELNCLSCENNYF